MAAFHTGCKMDAVDWYVTPWRTACQPVLQQQQQQQHKCKNNR
jgi:hypothetical protein